MSRFFRIFAIFYYLYKNYLDKLSEEGVGLDITNRPGTRTEH